MKPIIRKRRTVDGIAPSRPVSNTPVPKTLTQATSAWVNDIGFAIFDETADSRSRALIEVTTLDEMILRGSSVPSVVKIDVEGAEHAVLMGARDLLSRHRPLLMLELHLDIMERRGQAPREVVELLLSLGYRFQKLSGKKMGARDVYDVPHAIHRVIAV